VDNELYFYEYVERKANEIVGLLQRAKPEIFQAATQMAVTKTSQLHSLLHVQIAGLEIGKEVEIEVGEARDDGQTALFPVRWRATGQDWLFPSMKGEIEVTALDNFAPLTQVALRGRYRPPASLIGALGDAVIGHRLAEAAVRHFVLDLARRLATA
jgi:hypothetical protein